MIVFCKRYWWAILVVAFLLVLYHHALPGDLFPDPTSTVIEDREGNLLGARIAADGQWRFPDMDSVPWRFHVSLLLFEDRYFHYHPGFNPIALCKALYYNAKSGRMARGGSTITMQVVRLSRKNRPRTVWEKVTEIMLATRLEWRHSKEEILLLYASNAPFGGNVVGLEAASWRYFSRSPHDLSWAETATLAVLPNAPSLIYPGKNQDFLLVKRNSLLDQLYHAGHLDSLTCMLSKAEPLPERPYPLPQITRHLLDRVARDLAGKRIVTTIDRHLQQQAHAIIHEYASANRSNEIYNAAAIVIHVQSGEVLAYIGNTDHGQGTAHGQQVDIIRAPRSTGSLLKPVLFALAMQEGILLPNTLLPDIPTQIAGYSPKNFFLSYDGAVQAKRSLSRSLNVPSVRLLRDYGVEKLHHYLAEYGITTLTFPPAHYGLSLILGGAEGSLWDMSGMYASFSRILLDEQGVFRHNDMPLIRPPHYVPGDTVTNSGKTVNNSWLDAGAVWLMYEAMVEVNRPDLDSEWQLYSSPRKIAWKTGTSFGGRDAWAIGTTPDYVVGVWVGNASGAGRPGLTGLGNAAPVMFDVFGLLPAGGWFEQPFARMASVAVCRESGHRAGLFCEHIDTMWVHRNGIHTRACPYHQLVHLDASGNFRVNSICEDVSDMVRKSWFVLPPAMEWFYKFRNPSYRQLPSYRDDCSGNEDAGSMDMIYPTDTRIVYIPYELDGSRGSAVFEVAHRNPRASLFWHLNDQFIGVTSHIHRMAVQAGKGQHVITVVDDQGERLTRVVEVVE
jgi:penicillin-binding protein 1C